MHISSDMRRDPKLDTRPGSLALNRQGDAYRLVRDCLEGDPGVAFDKKLDEWATNKDAFEIGIEKHRNGPEAIVGVSIDIECNRIY